MSRTGAINSFFVLDVGHGSCAALVQGASALLIDVGPGASILQFLKDNGIERIESIIVSHADADHLGGLVGLLAAKEVEIENVYVNPDGVKDSDLWKDVAYELDDLQEAGVVVTTVGLARGNAVECSLEGWAIEVLAPRQRLLQLGVGNRDKRDRLIATNAISAVVRVMHDSFPLAICPGDIDYVGYLHLVDYPESPIAEMEAKVLILPHHGGFSGSPAQTEEVISGLMDAVKPARVITSHGRRKHKNPLELVVDTVRARASSGIHFACTQMSQNCLDGPKDLGLPRVSPHASAGGEAGISCAGTLEILVNGDMPTSGAHRTMIETYAPERLCQ
ncbi:ComEC/Rec2 family competence protein [Georgenia muralis]|uniref:Beta-lactamase superfamily II metal-dependent hydrolase n=1 Tax=Georgenia muralis TaxID=154117 RepID=A0A3N4Z0A3_9MICO|nr:MBL fold metallo-hydrolase [Georgenia muralis]RPF25997.1 beta-lactamase superfamily II metal-dependent hydrolase [Georgenia muralis]